MIAIKNGIVWTITNGKLENGTVLVDGGRIAAIGVDIDIPEGAQVIDASDKTVMPGMIFVFFMPGMICCFGDGLRISVLRMIVHMVFP